MVPGTYTLQENIELSQLKTDFDKLIEIKKAKYMTDKIYFHASIEMINQFHNAKSSDCVIASCEQLISKGYKVYIVTNETNISDVGAKLNFPVRFKAEGNYAKAFIAKVGADYSIMKDVMRGLAKHVPTGVLIMKKQRVR